MKSFLIPVLLCISILSVTSCEVFGDSEYKYVVTGTSGDYSVTFQNEDDNTQQNSSVSNGWSYSWMQGGTRWLYISAQNNKSTGDVTVRIYRDGEIVESNTSYGGYSIATVSGEY